MSIAPLSAISILLCAGIASALFLPVMGLSPIVGYLLAGMAFGEHGLHIIPDGDIVDLLAEMGVVFLMFDIGLHFSLRHIWSERKAIFILGPGQVLLSGIFFYLGLAHFLDFALEVNVLLAAGLSLSSTAVVSQVLTEKKLNGLPLASTSMAMLIFQDICAIFLLILANSLGGGTGPTDGILLMAALKCVASVTVAIVLGKYFLSPAFNFIARFNNSEAFTMIALLVVLATGIATAAFGLSLTLGAFLAGMIVSETPFRHIIQTEIKPFRNLLLGFFFITVGMSINIGTLVHAWDTTLVIMLGAMAIKLSTIFMLFIILREGKVAAIQQAFLLFQGSEFVFVILAQPGLNGVMDPALKDAIIAGVAISMALTSILFGLGKKLVRQLIDAKPTVDTSEIAKKSNSVVIIGMNEVAETVALALKAHDSPYIIVERDYQKFAWAQENGFPVVYGDKSDLRFWDSIGIDMYKTVVISSPDLAFSRIYAGLPKERYTHITRFLNVASEEEAEVYRGMNYARIFIAHGKPPGIEMAASILAHLNHDAEKIANWMDKGQKLYLEKHAARA